MSDLAAADVARLVAGAREVRLRPGQVLFRQGEQAESMVHVRSGRVVLERTTADGRRLSIHTARQGELLADAAVFSRVYHCDARAEVTSSVDLISRHRLLRTLKTDPELAISLLSLFAKRLRNLRQRQEIREIRSADARILAHLRSLAGDDGVVALDRPLRAVAAEIGLSPEAVYRAVGALQRRGFVRRRPRSRMIQIMS